MAKDKAIKNNGTYIFADFSRGLYLLDTPRGLGEQLGSLALVDGRNVWAEHGALVPQYGYEIKATLPRGTDSEGRELLPIISGWTKADLSADNFMVLANTISAKFDVTNFTVEGTPTISDEGIMSGCSLSNYIANEIDVSSGNKIVIRGSFTWDGTQSTGGVVGLGANSARCITMYVNGAAPRVDFVFANINSTNTVVSSETIEADTEYEFEIEVEGADATCKLNGEVIGTVDDYNDTALDLLTIGIDGLLASSFSEGSIDLAKFRLFVNNTKLVSGMDDEYNGVVYVYSASQGLKRYKTVFSGGFTEPVITRRGKDIILYDSGVCYLFGAYYGNNSVSNVQITEGPCAFSDYSTFGIIRVTLDDVQYFWNGKEVLIDTNPCTVTSVSIGADDDYAEVRIVPFSGSFDYGVTPATVIPYEKTKIAVTLVYEPEDAQLSSVTLTPEMMAVANNRLFVANSDGNIYYSSIGFSFVDSVYDPLNPFDEEAGAGYFGGFYNDTTKLLAVEDYFNGVLLTKENGFYYLTIGDSVTVDKISQAGQKYASDHVIVGNDVFAYDCNSGALVKAAQVNVFGALTAGKIFVTSEYLNVQNFNINTSKRSLTYNFEAQVLILYYGEDLKRGVVYSVPNEALFPRELDKVCLGYIGFNQGVVGVTATAEIIQDFKKGMIIPNLTCVAQFEPIGVRDNRMICSTILEVTELNGINYNVTTQNAGASFQQIQPSFYIAASGEQLLPFIYSEEDYLADSYQLTSRWAEISSHRTRIYAPMSGRSGVSIQLEFEADKPFCLSMLRLPDFSQGN